MTFKQYYSTLVPGRITIHGKEWKNMNFFTVLELNSEKVNSCSSNLVSIGAKKQNTNVTKTDNKKCIEFQSIFDDKQPNK